jgi:signal transduction histidine kinase
MMEDSFDPSLLGGLLGLIVHDLRNPLSALHSNASFLQSTREGVNSEVREALEDVTASCDALGHIMDNLELLALSLRAERRFEKNSFAVRDLVTDVVSRARSLAVSYGAELEFQSSPDADHRVTANREMLGRALGNLIRNSIQHAQNGSLVTISVRLGPEQIALVVEDNGVSLAPELYDVAFTAPGQLSSKGFSAGRYSRGIGLFAARLAAESAGAVVRAIGSASGQGNKFELELPR